VEEDEEMKREEERGAAKRPDLNELDVPEWAELALDRVEWRKLLQRIARLFREPQAERSDQGVGSDWERGDFRRGHSSHNDKVRRAPRWLDWPDTGRAWWAAD
jgi:hypothetical protein